ncbi:F-box domain-containing protein [Apodospora peruviana]|uniref:F-box domain-containing protein n=1 Tax=Apodospora peruviana TaxID=516989 RepID=A0AAE0M8H0_9PEZI|nr:F-box domain-containing protein [Apodospora peruviana]
MDENKPEMPQAVPPDETITEEELLATTPPRIWGGLDAEDETNLHRLSSVSYESVQNGAFAESLTVDPSIHMPPYLDHQIASTLREQTWDAEGSLPGKWKGKSVELDSLPSNSQCHLLSLPSELIDAVLFYISPLELTRVSATCRVLYNYATADHIWQALVQSHVPGQRVTTPYPCKSYRDLFKAHDPRWFVPKYKIWFSDGDLAGRLILTRYDQRRGCIEGYQLVAVSNRKAFQAWRATDNEVIIHAFEPEVKLHLDKPILHLPAETHDHDSGAGHVGPITVIPLHDAENDTDTTEAAAGSSSSHQPNAAATHKNMETTTNRPRENRFQTETPMPLGSVDNRTYCNFMLARPLEPREIAVRPPLGLPFPYGKIWPPPTIPARHRVSGASVHRVESSPFTYDVPGPSCRQEVSDQVFRIRKWMQYPSGLGLGVYLTANLLHGGRGGFDASAVRLVRNIGLDSILPNRDPINIGEEVATYATLDPALYTPTPEKPYRGIWVGDYSGHGCEFLLINQPDDDPDEPDDPDSIVRRETETDEEFARRKHDETVYRGRLEAIKLTGDANVPRGEYTFVADDIGEKGFVTVVQDEPFVGARVVSSKGHIAHTGFLNDKYIESQLLLISHDRLAQYWVGFGHISFFERVDIDRFLVPE